MAQAFTDAKKKKSGALVKKKIEEIKNPKWDQFIIESFLPERMKDEYISLIKRKSIQIEL